jgi:nucleoside-diphosphate-sugar epimerase
MVTYTPCALPPRLAGQLRTGAWSVAITGSSGWMGLALLEMLEPVFGDAYDTRVAAFGSRARTITLRSGRSVALRLTDTLGNLPPANWLLVHAAYGTRDRVSTQGQAQFVGSNIALTENVTQSICALRPACILFPSSGAVYAADGSLAQDIETNPYGVLKQRDEQHFAALAREIGARIAIPRIFNMGGPYINKWSAYALSDLIVQLQEGKTLQINARGAVMRSYVHVADILTLSLAWLLDDAAASVITFDTRGAEDIEVADLARHIESLLLDAPRSHPRVADGSLPGNIYLGNPEPMRSLCRTYGVTLQNLNSQILQTAEDIALRRAKES